MRIDDLNRTRLAAGTEKTDPAASNRAGTKDGTAAANTDQADVSRLAQALSSRDPQRLEQLRLEVQSGKYNVSAQEVAKSIIKAHLGD
ncbi:MAG TPA: flagellar biosynthesis anti-sigma factor FlgM [Bryobacteraceae bacterium]|nr:flagellar biosynthesis anti-sigma factor FlgM [Bryobacteraceae bacterium]